KSKRRRYKEQKIQADFTKYLRKEYPGSLACANCAGAYTSRFHGKLAKERGYVKGAPDYSIHEPNAYYHGLFIEFKCDTGYLRKEQREWLEKLRARKYNAVCCKSLEDACRVLDEHMKTALYYRNPDKTIHSHSIDMDSAETDAPQS